MFKKLFKTKVILDTNFVMIPGEIGIDVFTEVSQLVDVPHKVCVMKGTENELMGIVTSFKNKKEGFNAKLAYVMLKQKKIKILNHSEGHVDDAIHSYAIENNAIVCTQDKELRARLKQKGIKIIGLRQKKYLDWA